MPTYISVAVGVIENAEHKVLITQRPAKGPYASFWEFPGGKVEQKEISRQALTRELQEELGIAVQRATPLIRLQHDYGDRQVLLDVWRILDYTGEPYGREGQTVAWVTLDQLTNSQLLPANKTIVTAMRLPSHYVITPSGKTEDQLYKHVQKVLQNGYRFIRFRAQGWEKVQYKRMLPELIELCAAPQAQLMIDGLPEDVEKFNVTGLHLTSAQLFEYNERPIAKNYWLGASCHTQQALQQAAKLNADFAVLSPVLPTTSHPYVKPLGWNRFVELAKKVDFPVYALGGMHLTQPAIWFGAQGIAGISMF